MLGALVALTALTRGEALVLLPLVLIPVVWRRGAWRRDGLRAAAVALVAFLIVLTPLDRAQLDRVQPAGRDRDQLGTAVAGANCAVTYASGDHLGGWYPPCIKEHPGKNEAEHHAEALKDGVRYAATTWAASRWCWRLASGASGASTSRSRSRRGARCAFRRSA